MEVVIQEQGKNFWYRNWYAFVAIFILAILKTKTQEFTQIIRVLEEKFLSPTLGQTMFFLGCLTLSILIIIALLRVYIFRKSINFHGAIVDILDEIANSNVNFFRYSFNVKDSMEFFVKTGSLFISLYVSYLGFQIFIETFLIISQLKVQTFLSYLLIGFLAILTSFYISMFPVILAFLDPKFLIESKIIQSRVFTGIFMALFAAFLSFNSLKGILILILNQGI
jgi:hypothetical protein